MSYILLKYLHVGCVVLTILLFAMRLSLAATGRDYRRYGPLRWIPHVVDTVLLASAGLLAWRTSQYPFAESWLTVKLLALPFYIVAGAIALDPSRKAKMRAISGALAVVIIIYIVLVAITRQPLPL